MQSATEIIRWLQTLPEGSAVGIDEGGLTLKEITPENKVGEAYLEIGGIPDMIDCALCDKTIPFEDSWSPGDEAICAKCDTEVTGRNHEEPMTDGQVTELVKEMRKECRAAGVRLSVVNLSWGPHANFFINDFRVGNVTGSHFYSEYREQFDAVQRIKEKYYPLLGTVMKGLKP